MVPTKGDVTDEYNAGRGARVVGQAEVPAPVQTTGGSRVVGQAELPKDTRSKKQREFDREMRF